MRLHKYLSKAGVASLRKAEAMILAGRVKVNHELITSLGSLVDTDDIIMVDDEVIGLSHYEYYILYKPKNVLSSVSDDRNRQVVTDLIKSEVQLYPVGRLDRDTTGLLLMTNDGQFAHTMMHPSFEIVKSYEATIRGPISKKDLSLLESGVLLDDGTYSDKATIEYVRSLNRTTKIGISIAQGKNRIIKRMFKGIDKDLIALHRYQYGNLTLGQLQVSQYRALKQSEIDSLYQLAKG